MRRLVETFIRRAGQYPAKQKTEVLETVEKMPLPPETFGIADKVTIKADLGILSPRTVKSVVKGHVVRDTGTHVTRTSVRKVAVGTARPVASEGPFVGRRRDATRPNGK